MFRGTFFHTLDEKGRVAIPRKFRESLGSLSDIRVVVTRAVTSGGKALDVYPTPEWERLEESIRKMPRFQESTSRFKRRYLAPAQEVSLDAQGRILVPQDLRDAIGLGKEAVFTGDLEKFQIWSRPGWQRQQEDDARRYEEDQEPFDDLGL